MKESLANVSLDLTGLTIALSGTDYHAMERWIVQATRTLHNAIRLDNTLTFADIEELLVLHPCEDCQHLVRSICIPWASGEAGHVSVH